MKANKRIFTICINLLPPILMVLLIPFVSNDYILTVLYIIIMIIAVTAKYEKGEYKYILFGFFIMIASEYLFISTGVEVFRRNSLFSAMPLWLPFLWGYTFLAMKRAIILLGD